MRGAHCKREVKHVQSRIIPAYAGSTNRQNACQAFGRDHPRVCGEHTAKQTDPLTYGGSSPRMRGALFTVIVLILWPRIIPAYAGSTMLSCITAMHIWDHPRVCGEHRCTSQSRGPCRGSSPRMRGALWIGCGLPAGNGIIPAYAGSTHCCCRQANKQRDHPRVCGEHWMVSGMVWHGGGSSPRMRGALRVSGEVSQVLRIIPAYAGSTSDL